MDVKGAYVKVLGSGCKKCNELEENTVAALKLLGRNTAVEHVTDFAKVAEYGVMATPALVLGDKVVSSGRVFMEVAADISLRDRIVRISRGKIYRRDG